MSDSQKTVFTLLVVLLTACDATTTSADDQTPPAIKCPQNTKPIALAARSDGIYVLCTGQNYGEPSNPGYVIRV